MTVAEVHRAASPPPPVAIAVPSEPQNSFERELNESVKDRQVIQRTRSQGSYLQLVIRTFMIVLNQNCR